MEPTGLVPTRNALLIVSAVLVVAAAGCLSGLAFGDPGDERAETIYTALLGVSLVGLAGALRTASFRARAIRQATDALLGPLAEEGASLTVNPMDTRYWQEHYRLLLTLGAYREAELVLAYVKTRRC